MILVSNWPIFSTMHSALFLRKIVLASNAWATREIGQMSKRDPAVPHIIKGMKPSSCTLTALAKAILVPADTGSSSFIALIVKN